MAYTRQPTVLTVATAMGTYFVPLLTPANQMSYDTAQFYNSALAIVTGCVVAALSFRLLPPLPPGLRARRLLALTLGDLRRLAMRALPPSPEDWQGRVYGRLAALPDQAQPLQRARLLAALSVGNEIGQLRRMSHLLGVGAELSAAFAAVTQCDSAMARSRLAGLDSRLASPPGTEPSAVLALRARSSILGLSEALAEHADYFDAGAAA